MKKRDTPIERIPNLGFKQIDLFLMFMTVRDLGGYQQVTSQQLWKQVYNMLGGNPRSTSAATCTRRHYEKLLLPYECHVKGIPMNLLPQHQPKHHHYSNYSKDDDDGQRPAKRKLLSIPLPQNPHTPQSSRHGTAFHLPLHYPRFYHPNHVVLPPHAPLPASVLTPQSHPAQQPRLSFSPYRPSPTESIKEPLEHLRYLAERYKTSSGLTEPLNLSVKASRPETNSNPASSFAPPPANKNPKFLNKPSPLYTPRHPQVVRNETQDGEAGVADTPYSYPVGAGETYVVDVKAITKGSPTYDLAPTLRADEGATTMPKNRSSPKTDFTMQPKEDREGSPEVRELNLGHVLPRIPRENGGEMEIEIPLSVFRNWLRLCGSSTALPTLEDISRQRSCSDTDVLPTNLTFRMNPQQWSPVAEDLRLRSSPPPTNQPNGTHHDTSQNSLPSYKPLPTGGILKNAASQDIYQFDQQDINKTYSCKPTTCWDAYDQETQALPLQAKIDSNPLTVQQNIDPPKERSEMAPSAVFTLNSSSASLLRLTAEEVMKLKRIISSSS
ncbi:AT-rich interaction domain 6 [Symphorus nematophorus]